MNAIVQKAVGRLLLIVVVCGAVALAPRAAWAAQAAAQGAAVHHGGEATLVVPDLGSVEFRGVNGRTLLMGGLVISALGLLFGLLTFTQLRNLPVHVSMREVSEL